MMIVAAIKQMQYMANHACAVGSQPPAPAGVVVRCAHSVKTGMTSAGIVGRQEDAELCSQYSFMLHTYACSIYGSLIAKLLAQLWESLSVKEVSMARKKQVSTAQPIMLSVAEVAVHLGVCRQTVYNLIYDGSLPSVKIRGLRRVSRISLDDWLKQLETA